jgi:cell division protein FtsN
VRIQTGSFTVAENATFMARDLAAAGFTTTTERAVLSGKTYYRVFLSRAMAQEEARTTLIKLKEAGFEGVRVP